MADDLSVTPGTGATIAADDISGKLHQRVKLTWGVDGAAVDASATNPLPVEVRSGGADLGKAEDAAHSSGDRGVMALAVRKDVAAALAGSDGDYIPLVTDAKGALHTRGAGIQSGALTVTKQLVLGAAAGLPVSPAAGRRNVRISHAGRGGRLWVGGSGVSLQAGLQVLPTHPPLDFPVDGGQIYGISESWTLAQRLGTETHVLSIAYISGSGDTAVLVAGTYPTGQVYRSVDGGCTPVAIMEW